VSCKRHKLIDIAISQVGVKEETGNNDGPEVEAYLDSVGLSKGNPWCAAFLFWLHSEAGIDAPKSGWSPDWVKANRVQPKDVQPGDVFSLWSSKHNRYRHVGIVVEVDGNYIKTIEGNSGNGVTEHRRPIKSIPAFSRYWEV